MSSVADKRVNVQEILKKFETNVENTKDGLPPPPRTTTAAAQVKPAARSFSERSIVPVRPNRSKVTFSNRKSNSLGNHHEKFQQPTLASQRKRTELSTTNKMFDTELRSVSEISRIFQEKQIGARNQEQALSSAARLSTAAGDIKIPSNIQKDRLALKETNCCDVNNDKKKDILGSPSPERTSVEFVISKPPRKPIRTFAHDVYLNNKKFQRDKKNSSSKAVDSESQKLSRTESYKIMTPSKPKLPPKPVMRSKTEPEMLVRSTHKPLVKNNNCNNNNNNDNISPDNAAKSNNKVARPLGPPPQPPMSRPTTLEPYAVIMRDRNLRLNLENEYTVPSRNGMRTYGKILKRSYSDEHIYDEPWKNNCCLGASCETIVDAMPNCDEEFVVVDNEIYGDVVGYVDDGVSHEKESDKPQRQNSGDGSKELHYMSSPIMACVSPPKNELRRCRSRSVSSRKGVRHHENEVGRKHSCRIVNDRDLVNWSFSAVYATTPRSHKSRGNKDTDSCDSETDEISEKEVRERIAYIHKISRGPSLKHDSKVFNSTYRRQFDAVLIVGLQLGQDGTSIKSFVKDVFPNADSLKADVDTIARFCFPDAESWRPSLLGEVHTFVLTNEFGERLFGYCRRVKPEGASSSLPVVYCIISPILARAYYSQVLREIEKRHGLSDAKMRGFLQLLRNRSVPHPGRTIQLRCSNMEEEIRFAISRSNDCGLDNGDTVRLLSCLSVSNLLKVFSSLLLERRVLFYSSSLNVLTESILALVSLLYPFTWQHTLIPILPQSMLDIVSSPTPYIIGIMKCAYPLVSELPREEGIIIDLDESQIVSESGDEDTILPKKIFKGITASLKFVKHRSEMPGSPSSFLISEAFLTMFVKLVGHYQQHIDILPDGQKLFKRESFCSAPLSHSEQLFLKWFSETQMFQIFVEKKLSSNSTEYDVFEKHIEKHRMELEVFKPTIRTNVVGFGMKVKHFGEKLIGIKSPSKA